MDERRGEVEYAIRKLFVRSDAIELNAVESAPVHLRFLALRLLFNDDLCFLRLLLLKEALSELLHPCCFLTELLVKGLEIPLGGISGGKLWLALRKLNRLWCQHFDFESAEVGTRPGLDLISDLFHSAKGLLKLSETVPKH